MLDNILNKIDSFLKKTNSIISLTKDIKIPNNINIKKTEKEKKNVNNNSSITFFK